MHWFTEPLSQALRFTVSDGVIWVTAWVAIALSIILIVLTATYITRGRDLDSGMSTRDLSMNDVVRYIRRHSRRGGTYDQDATTVIMPGVPKSHWAISNDTWHDHEHPIDAPTTGRRAADNMARVIVPRDWMPVIGARRIANLVGSTT